MPKYKIESQRTKDAVKSIIDRLPDGKRYDVEIKLLRAKRTIPQNRLLHLWCKCIEEDTGQDAESVKRFCKEQFLGYKEVAMFGQKSFELTSTTSLNTLQFTLFMKKIQAWAASELGIVLPIREDLIFQQFLEYYEDR